MRKSIRTVTLGVVLALAVLGMPSSVFADVIPVGDGVWQTFSWLGGPNVTQTQAPFTFTSATAVTVQVTDAYLPGDRFSLTDNGTLVGTTSQLNTSPPYTTNPNTAYATGFSQGLFNLAAGSHSLVLKDIQIANDPIGNPINSGAAFFRVLTAGGNVGVSEVAPEPSSLALVGMGIAGLALRRLRRRKAAQAEVAVA